MCKKGDSQIAGVPSLEDTTRTAAHCQQSCHWCLPDTLLMRVTSASIGQETQEGSRHVDWAHHCPPSPPPLMLLQMSTSGSSWEDRMKMFHLSSPLCGVPKVPEVTGDHSGHYLSDDQAGTVRELPMSVGKVDWSAPQGHGGHRGHGEGLLWVELHHQLTVVAWRTAEHWKTSCITETVPC